MCNIVIIMTAALALISGQAYAQTPLSCSDSAVTSLNWNDTELFGYWYEVIRNPFASVACLQFNVSRTADNNALIVNASHSNANNSYYQNIDETSNVNLTDVNMAVGYNVTFTTGTVVSKPVYIKLLNTTSNLAVGCGYTDPKDNSTSYGFVLSRTSNYNVLEMNDLNANVSHSFANFKNGSYWNVAQAGCYRSSAAQSLPLMSGFVALALLLIKTH